MALEYYLNKFRDLNTLRLQGHNKAYKICMLLAVTDLGELGVISQSRMELTKH